MLLVHWKCNEILVSICFSDVRITNLRAWIVQSVIAIFKSTEESGRQMSKVKIRNFDSWSNCNKKWQADKSRIFAPKNLFQGYLYNVTLSISVFYAIMHDLIWSTIIRKIWHLVQRKTRKRFCLSFLTRSNLPLLALYLI